MSISTVVGYVQAPECCVCRVGARQAAARESVEGDNGRVLYCCSASHSIQLGVVCTAWGLHQAVCLRVCPAAPQARCPPAGFALLSSVAALVCASSESVGLWLLSRFEVWQRWSTLRLLSLTDYQVSEVAVFVICVVLGVWSSCQLQRQYCP